MLKKIQTKYIKKKIEKRNKEAFGEQILRLNGKTEQKIFECDTF